jgi:putative redox protein
MNTAEVIYQGQLRSECIHLQSGTTIVTDAPTDNFGKGEAFSPTDLVATALASCMITTIGILTRQENINLDGSKLTVKKIMDANPRRIAQIHIDVEINNHELSEEQKSRIEEIAHNCPVAKSLHPDLIQKVTFIYN